MNMLAVPERTNMQRWVLLGLLSVAFAINYTDREFLFAVFPQLQRELFLSNTQLGLVGSVFTCTYALAMPVAGYLADRLPRHRLVISALILWSLATLGTSLSRDVSQILLWRVIMGFTEALYVPAAVGMIADAHSGATRSRALAIHSSAQFLGLTAGGVYGGWAAEEFGWRRGSQILAAVGLAYSIVLIGQFWRMSYRSPADDEQPSSPWEALRSIRFVLLALTFCIFCSMLWVMYVWLPTVVHETYRINLLKSGLASTLYLQSGSALGVLTGGSLADWAANKKVTGRLDVAVGGLLCCAPFALLIFTTHSLWFLRLATLGFGFTSGFFIANVFALLYDFVAHSNFGFATGVLNMTGGLGGGIAILLAGMFKSGWGISSLMLLLSLCTSVCACTLFAASRIGGKATGSLRSPPAPPG
jgi:MFS family permease